MENIFENAYYGKPYKAKNGIKAFYHRVFGKIVYCMLEDCRELVPYTLDGKCQGDDYHDIVSEWIEETDEEEYPKHSRFIYQVGSEPTFKVGDTIAYWDTCPDFEGEFIFGEVTAIEFEDYYEDWMYTFKDSDYENFETEEQLIQLCAYSKNKI